MSGRIAIAWCVVWLLIWAASVATAVGWWELGSPLVLGQPVYQSKFMTVYAPWQAWDWWQEWGHDQAFRATFVAGAKNALWGSFLAVLIMYWLVYSYGDLPHVDEEDQPHRFGTIQDLLESRRISMKQAGIVLGRWGRKIVYHVGDDHVVLIGASRVGEKGVSFVLPTIIDWPHSLVVFDPKSELFEATADERAKRGPVYLVNPTRVGSHHFNPLLELRDGEMNIGDCRTLGMLFTHGMEGKDPFWATAAAELAAAIARVVCTDGGPRTLQRMLAMGRGIAQDKRPATTDSYASPIIDVHMARAKERGVRPGVEAQLMLALAAAGDPIGAAATSRSDFTVADICAGPKPVTVYITLPVSQADSLKHMARIILQALMLGQLHDQRHATDGRLKLRRTLWLADEFPTLGYLPFIDRGVALAAGYLLKFMLVAQSINQIEDAYGKEQSIIDNAGTFVWVPGTSEATYRYATAMCGTMIAHMRARHRKVGVFDRPSETASQSRHPVLNMRDANLMGRDHALIMHHGSLPVWLRKARFYELPRYSGKIVDTHWSEDAA